MDGTALFSFYTLTPPLPVFTHLLGAWQTTQSSQLHWGYDSPRSSYTHRAQQTTVCIHPLGAWQTTQSSQTHLGHGTPQSAYIHWGHGRPQSSQPHLGHGTPQSSYTHWGMADHTVSIHPLGYGRLQSSYTQWGHGRPHCLSDHSLSYTHQGHGTLHSLHIPTGGMADQKVFTHSLWAWQTTAFMNNNYVCGLACHV